MFEVTTDSSLNSNLFLDDVFLASTALTLPAEMIPEVVNLAAITKERWGKRN
jgi:hypothetical protein